MPKGKGTYGKKVGRPKKKKKMKKVKSEMAKYKGKSVRLNKPTRIRKGQTSYGRKKFQVYVKAGSRVKRVTFGDLI